MGGMWNTVHGLKWVSLWPDLVAVSPLLVEIEAVLWDPTVGSKRGCSHPCQASLLCIACWRLGAVCPSCCAALTQFPGVGSCCICFPTPL